MIYDLLEDRVEYISDNAERILRISSGKAIKQCLDRACIP